MEQRIRERLTDTVLDEVRERYDIEEGGLHELDAFESFIFEFERDGSPHILRLSHSLRRTEGLIHGEIDWINYLWAGGAGVARALPSARGQLVEAIDDGAGGQFLATGFEKAQGMNPWQAGWTTPNGQFVGLRQTLDATPAWVSTGLSGAKFTGSAEMGGRTWEVRTDERNQLFAVSTTPDRLTTVVSATGGIEDIRFFVDKLTPAKPAS